MWGDFIRCEFEKEGDSMRRATLIFVPLFLMALLVFPVYADEETWTQEWTLEDYDTGETVVRLEITLTGQADPWQGETFAYESEFIVEYWDEEIAEDNYIKLKECIFEYEGDEDFSFNKIKEEDLYDKKIRDEGTFEQVTINIEFPEGVENQEIDIKVIWVFEWYYTYTFLGMEYEESDTRNVYVRSGYISLADYHKPKEGEQGPTGFCLGTFLVALIPISALVGIYTCTKKRKEGI